MGKTKEDKVSLNHRPPEKGKLPVAILVDPGTRSWGGPKQSTVCAEKKKPLQNWAHKCRKGC